MKLFPDQEKCVAEVREAYRSSKRAPLLVAPTGSGKTIMFSHICRGAVDKGNRVTILVHRQELVDQVSRALKEFAVPHGIIDPHHPYHSTAPVQVASVFTQVRRLDRGKPPELIIIDEAHHAVLGSTWAKCLAAYNRVRLLGVTATPVRLSGEGLGDVFDALVEGPTTEDLISIGRLSPVKVYAPPSVDVSDIRRAGGDFIKSALSAAVDKPKITGDAIDHYKALTPGQQAAVFCISIEHANHITQQAREAGIFAVMIDGKMDKDVRRQVVEDFAARKFPWLVSVDVISEGFDCPGIEVGISLRPTQSLGLWLQQCGRILRAAPGKSHATILDHAGNSLRHGLPTERRSWSLDGTARKAAGAEGSVSVRVCPRCFSAQRGGKPTCQSCGYAFPVEARTVARESGTLREITAEEIARRRERQTQGQTRTLEQLTELGRIKGYKSPERWAAYVLAGREKKRNVT